MFDIGFWELLVLAGLGLLILGPERLPQVVRKVSRWLAQARRTAAQLRWQIERELDLSEQRDTARRNSSASGNEGSPDAADAQSTTDDVRDSPDHDASAAMQDRTRAPTRSPEHEVGDDGASPDR